MSIDTARPPEPPEGARAALVHLIERLPDAAVARLLAFVCAWMAGWQEPPCV